MHIWKWHRKVAGEKERETDQLSREVLQWPWISRGDHHALSPSHGLWCPQFLRRSQPPDTEYLLYAVNHIYVNFLFTTNYFTASSLRAVRQWLRSRQDSHEEVRPYLIQSTCFAITSGNTAIPLLMVFMVFISQLFCFIPRQVHRIQILVECCLPAHSRLTSFSWFEVVPIEVPGLQDDLYLIFVHAKTRGVYSNNSCLVRRFTSSFLHKELLCPSSRWNVFNLINRKF